ncbi:hypothetical protein [Roseateles terrae]|uniref:Uncharacterized protein n=1 Tax=Roseateles terrae TaxID=431060 RepID=A0ABR6GQW6_9BURK|nr:hypothetical protein [Roseateles terrae]MBB3194082.1 hypothetical protein [Roseateles terrae]OWQ87945.1 hypothetical protein CDN98_07270 [Roseateles terrae]
MALPAGGSRAEDCWPPRPLGRPVAAAAVRLGVAWAGWAQRQANHPQNRPLNRPQIRRPFQGATLQAPCPWV